MASEPLAARGVRPYGMALRTELDKTAHLLRRFGLGASEAEIDWYGEGGHKGAIERLLNYEERPDSWTFDIDMVRNEKGNLPMAVAQAWWYSRILCTNRPLQEKLAVFWHDHFATSGAKVDVSLVMHRHIETIRSHVLGRFHDMLEAVSKDPAMLYWLDNHENVKGRPNENFAREVMELFTLGIGHYTEKDIQEAARAFTGWTFARPGGRRASRLEKPGPLAVFAMDEASHDPGDKTVFGRTGAFDGDDVLRLLCEQPQTSRFLVKKMWEWFVFPEPSPRLVERLAVKYRASGLDNRVLVRSIMEAPEFYSAEAEKGVIKDPVDFCISTARAMGINSLQMRLLEEAQAAAGNDAARRRPVALGALLLQATKAMGMTLMMPPDVSGWEIGQGWISSATMVERMKWADRLFLGLGRQQTGGAAAQQGAYFYDMFGGSSSPEDLVEKVLSIFDAEDLKPKAPSLVSGAEEESGGDVTPQNVRKALSLVARAVFGSPEFQFA